MWRRFWGTMIWCGDFSMHTALGVSIHGFVERSEWTPNEYTIQIAAALIRAGARVEAVKMTLAAAVCLGRAGDVARLAPEARARDLQMAYRAAQCGVFRLARHGEGADGGLSHGRAGYGLPGYAARLGRIFCARETGSDQARCRHCRLSSRGGETGMIQRAARAGPVIGGIPQEAP